MTTPTIHLGPGRALWLDAAGTLLHPAKPVWQVYAAAASQHGPNPDPARVRDRLGPAMRRLRPLRCGEPSWETYWRGVIEEATGCDHDAVYRSLYAHYGRAEAWRVAAGAREGIERVRAGGTRVALVSNWDDRLRPLIADLGLAAHFDAVVVSGEEGVEKPDPEIFMRTASRLAVEARCSVMFGDNVKNDVDGAMGAGAAAFCFGRDFSGFREFFSAVI